jgi:BirA family biotin operon repressor/biotin-[acetyl-CoA-carboxylase] ligase
MLSKLCHKIDNRYRQLLRGDMWQIDNDYEGMLYQRGIWSEYSDETGDFEGLILGVDQIGRLMIETRAGIVNKYHFKEVIFK